MLVGVPHPVMVGEGGYPSSHGGGWYPVQSWWGGWYPIQSCYRGVPIQSWWEGVVPHSVMLQGVPHPVMMGGTEGNPNPDLDSWGALGTPHHPDLARGVPLVPPPSRPGQGWYSRYPPPSRPMIGYPPSRPGTGYPSPYPDLGQGTPPPMVNRQTFPSINITFPRTTYAGGKNQTLWLLKQFNCKKINICEKWAPLTSVKMVPGSPKKGDRLISRHRQHEKLWSCWLTEIDSYKLPFWSNIVKDYLFWDKRFQLSFCMFN